MNSDPGFAIWITGLPASGKSTITSDLVARLEAQKIPVVVLESDFMRTILTPHATYAPEERDAFYRSLVLIGDLLVRSGVNVIFDATGNKRAYRDHARSLLPKFVEVYSACPLDVCRARDPKGIYRLAASGRADAVPGVQAAYEPPEHPEVTLNCSTLTRETDTDVILDKLKQLMYI